MRITTWAEYGLICALNLARRYGDGPVTGRDIATQEKLPADYVEQILLRLRRADSQKLHLGGGGIAQGAEQIEDRRHAQLSPHRRHVPHGGMKLLGEAKANAYFRQAALDDRQEVGGLRLEHDLAGRQPRDIEQVLESGPFELVTGRDVVLILHAGRWTWAREHPRTSREQLRDEHLERVVDALRAAGIDGFVVPDPAGARHQVGVRGERWGPALAALVAALRGEAWYAESGGSR